MIAASPFFKAMFGPNYKEANTNEIPMQAMSGDALNAIINFCYNGSADITSENVVDILAAASSVELVKLEQECANFLQQQLDAENVIQLLLIAEQYNLPSLGSKVTRFVCANFEEIPFDDAMQLDQQVFGKILKLDQIESDETEIFDLFVQWTEHDASNRSQFVATLAKSIRLQHIPTEVYANTTVISHRLIPITKIFSFQFLSARVEPYYGKYGCSELIADEKLKRLEEQQTIVLQRFVPKLFYANACHLEFRINKIKIFECIDEHCARFEENKAIAVEIPRQNHIFFGNKVYLFDNDDVRGDGKMESYDLLTSVKECFLDVPVALESGTLFVTGQYTYVLGRRSRADVDADALFTICYR